MTCPGVIKIYIDEALSKEEDNLASIGCVARTDSNALLKAAFLGFFLMLLTTNSLHVEAAAILGRLREERRFAGHLLSMSLIVKAGSSA